MSRADRWTCEQVFSRLDDYLDRELMPHEMQLVHEHLETCVWCARTYRFQEETLGALRDRLRRVPASTHLLAKVSEALKRASEHDDDPP